MKQNSITKVEPIKSSHTIGNTPVVGSTVYLMDCVAGMKEYPDKFFDLAICDPPYGIGFDGSRESTSKHGGRKAYEFKGWDKERPPYEYFLELWRVSKNQIIWGANYFTEHLPPSMGWIFWDKGQRICNSDGELAYTSFNRALRVVEANRVKIQEHGGAIHPTQKPVYLYDWILLNYAEKGQRILDTHVGSGSSRIAAHKNGFEFVGFEIDEEYYKLSEKRFNDYAMALRIEGWWYCLQLAHWRIRTLPKQRGNAGVFMSGVELAVHLMPKEPKMP